MTENEREGFVFESLRKSGVTAYLHDSELLQLRFLVQTVPTGQVKLEIGKGDIISDTKIYLLLPYTYTYTRTHTQTSSPPRS